MTLPTPDSASTIKQHPCKALSQKRPNALIPKQKIENAMTRTFLKQINLKRISGQKQRCIQTLEAPKETQQSSELTQQHSIFL